MTDIVGETATATAAGVASVPLVAVEGVAAATTAAGLASTPRIVVAGATATATATTILSDYYLRNDRDPPPVSWLDEEGNRQATPRTLQQALNNIYSRLNVLEKWSGVNQWSHGLTLDFIETIDSLD